MLLVETIKLVLIVLLLLLQLHFWLSVISKHHHRQFHFYLTILKTKIISLNSSFYF
ncbi:MAG: VirB3 family type IV secretion system protein [Candidatus Pacebacteria bacterium]|nr:VirB3 family type IV secretion system protein [Candidatus Paceibacterota bacterium]